MAYRNQMLFQGCDKLPGILFQRLAVFLATGGRQERNSIVTGHDMHVEMKHHLSAGGFVKLL